jgi:hypothetical protein
VCETVIDAVMTVGAEMEPGILVLVVISFLRKWQILFFTTQDLVSVGPKSC